METYAKAKPFTYSLGEYIRHERIKKQISQESLAKQFGVNGVALSMWELKRKPVHPKRFVIQFFSFYALLSLNASYLSPPLSGNYCLLVLIHY